LRDRPALALLVVAAAWYAVRGYLIWRSGWYPLADDAAVVLRSGDVLSRHSPLIGMPTSFNGLANQAVATNPAHAGPMVFWVIAPLATVFGLTVPVVLASTWGLLILTQTAITRFARQLGGRVAGLLSVAFGVVLVAYLATDWFLMPVNPVMAALPYGALLFVTWGVLAGDATKWPWFVVLASFVVQADLVFVPAVVVLAVACSADGVVRARRTRRDAARAADRPSARVWATCAGLAALCWVLPLVDALLHRGGNVTALASAAGEGLPTRGLGGAWSELGRLLDPFRLLTQNPFREEAERNWQFHLLGGWTAGSLVGLACLAGTLIAWRRRGWRISGSTRALLLSAVAAGGAAILSSALLPTSNLDPKYFLPRVVGYLYLWFAFGVAALSGARSLSPRRAMSPRRATAAAAACLGVVFVTQIAPGLGPRPVDMQYSAEFFDAPRSLAAQLARHSISDAAIQARDQHASAVMFGLLVATRDGGVRLRVDDSAGQYLGGFRSVDWASLPKQLQMTTAAIDPPAKDAELVGRWMPHPVSDDVLARAQARVARAVRSHPGLRVEPGMEAPFAQLLAGSAAYHGRAAPLWGDSYRADVANLIARPALVPRLPDGVLVEAAAAGYLGALPEIEPFRTELERQQTVVSVWRLDPLAQGRGDVS
jgi:hypothetical protein